MSISRYRAWIRALSCLESDRVRFVQQLQHPPGSFIEYFRFLNLWMYRELKSFRLILYLALVHGCNPFTILIHKLVLEMTTLDWEQVEDVGVVEEVEEDVEEELGMVLLHRHPRLTPHVNIWHIPRRLRGGLSSIWDCGNGSSAWCSEPGLAGVVGSCQSSTLRNLRRLRHAGSGMMSWPGFSRKAFFRRSCLQK